MKKLNQVDIILDKDTDVCEVELQKRANNKYVLYVHINGFTAMRVYSKKEVKVVKQ